MVKRLFDFFVALSALIVLSPLLLVIGVLIRMDSPGPALFRQERVGRFGRCFRIHKFRTMTLNAGTSSLQVTAANDRRITRIGRLLRRHKVDELPQLIDVLVGDMSLVGPRPEVPRYVAVWPNDATDEILSVRPGITDPIALEYFDEAGLLAGSADVEWAYLHEVLPRKISGYRQYIKSRTFWGDVRVIFVTVLRTFRA